MTVLCECNSEEECSTQVECESRKTVDTIAEAYQEIANVLAQLPFGAVAQHIKNLEVLANNHLELQKEKES